MYTRYRDYILAAVTGFFTGAFLFPVLFNLDIALPFGIPRIGVLVIIPLLWIFGIWLGGFLSRWFPFMAQFSRYVASGFLSFAIDFGILNFLILLTGVASGWGLAVFKGSSYIVANVNAYLWNKYWVFQLYKPLERVSFRGIFREYGRFLIVSIIGFLINVSLTSFIVDVIGPQFGFSEKLWANVAAATAAAITIIWNFAGYKLFVFKKKQAIQ